MSKQIPYGHTQISTNWHVLRIPRVSGDVAFFGESKSAVEEKEYNYWRKKQLREKNQQQRASAQRLRAQATARTTAHRDTIQAVAQAYRKEIPHIAIGGVVIVDQEHQAAGWMNRLRDPQGWEPGCTAVDASGSIWLAVDGDCVAGAQRWEQVHIASDPQNPPAQPAKPDPLRHLPAHIREFARAEQAKELQSSASQRGIRHAL
tara:strand:+ start:17191 stop:17802 length:612 start_codon:yes stop_codon:yes gene_type:complete